MIANKKIMAKNILHYMNVNNVTATDVCKACGFKQNTFSDWVNAKTYPRIDKIELMAKYFHINKACLVEEVSRLKEYSPDDSNLGEILVALPNDPELDNQIKEFIEVFMKLDPDDRAAFLKTLKAIQSKP